MPNVFDMMNISDLEEPIETMQNQKIVSVCRLLEACLGENSDFPFNSLDRDILKRSVNRTFVFCVAWGIGGSLNV